MKMGINMRRACEDIDLWLQLCGFSHAASSRVTAEAFSLSWRPAELTSGVVCSESAEAVSVLRGGRGRCKLYLPTPNSWC